jgi:hypothetical protein
MEGRLALGNRVGHVQHTCIIRVLRYRLEHLSDDFVLWAVKGKVTWKMSLDWQFISCLNRVQVQDRTFRLREKRRDVFRPLLIPR